MEVTAQRGDRRQQLQWEALTGAYQRCQDQLFSISAQLKMSSANVPSLWQDLETAENAKQELASANAALQEQLRCTLLEVAWLKLELEKAKCAGARLSQELLEARGICQEILSCTVGEA